MYAIIEQTPVQVVERFKTKSRLVIGFQLWDKSENAESERRFGDKREIICVFDEGSKQIVQFNALDINRYVSR
jgi:hypothetical protein